MLISNVRVYDLEETIKDSGFPMSSTPEYSLDRAKKLASVPSGSGHDCFLKGIVVRYTMQADHSFWLHFLRYHFSDIVSSESKMHSITKMKLHWHSYVSEESKYIATELIRAYNTKDLSLKDTILRMYGLSGEVDFNNQSQIFEAIIMNCPIGLELAASVTDNYLQIKTTYYQRKPHKMSSWQYYCNWVESLPNAKELILNKRK